MMKQINDKNLIGKTIKEFHCTKGSYDLVIVFQDNTFTVISSYPEEGDKIIKAGQKQARSGAFRSLTGDVDLRSAEQQANDLNLHQRFCNC